MPPFFYYFSFSSISIACIMIQKQNFELSSNSSSTCQIPVSFVHGPNKQTKNNPSPKWEKVLMCRPERSETENFLNPVKQKQEKKHLNREHPTESYHHGPGVLLLDSPARPGGPDRQVQPLLRLQVVRDCSGGDVLAEEGQAEPWDREGILPVRFTILIVGRNKNSLCMHAGKLRHTWIRNSQEASRTTRIRNTGIYLILSDKLFLHCRKLHDSKSPKVNL